MKNLAARISRACNLNYLGVLVGLLGFLAALSPSLMPRPPAFMGVLAACGFMIGYAVGVGLYDLYYWALDRKPASDANHRPGWVINIVGLAVIVGGVIWAQREQNQVRRLIGFEPMESLGLTQIVVYFVGLAFAILILARLIRLWVRWTNARVAKFQRMPRRIGVIVATLLAVGVLIALVDGAIVDRVKARMDAHYAAVNEKTNVGVEKPISPLRSGGPGSLVDWETLGRHGRSFTGSGPSASEITAFTQQPALEPIRVYVSGKQAPNPAARAALALEELERTGAFGRKVLIVSTTTGSGWIEPASAAAIEYMQGGDTAHVTIQYSYLPSALALLASRREATESGRALFDAVYDRWQELPEVQRPTLIVQGLSLGAFGGQAAFSSAADFALRTDGALFLGTPGFSQPWGNFTKNRDPGSPEIKPVYRRGRIVRFANDHDDLVQLAAEPQESRVLYLQYPSDPITWWSPRLIWHEPDWMREPPGHGVSPSLRWFPVITFLQLTLDQPFANSTPNGHGHNYAPDIVAAWAAVVPPEDWSVEKTNALQKVMDAKYGNTNPDAGL